MSRASTRLAWSIATWFGCGRVPKAPGTAGALGAIPLYLLAMCVGRAGVVAAALVVTAAGVWAASVVVRELKDDDPQVIVADEVAGMLITMIPVRAVSWLGVLLGFALFRLFDVVKPWPVRRFESLPGGWGVVMDDVAAGVLGAVVMAVLQATHVVP